MWLMVVVETHPEDVVDLRLDAPWPELQKLASTLNLEEMDSFEHGHVPYILILLKLLEQWKETVDLLYNAIADIALAWIVADDERQKSTKRPNTERKTFV